MSWVPLAKAVAPPVLWQAIFKRLVIKNIPDADRYQPFYSPWLASSFLALYEEIRPYTVASIASCWTLSQMLAQALNVEGDVMEAGVFQGGTARLLRRRLDDSSSGDRSLYLFDSFEGMENVSDSLDRHQRGDFADTSLEAVRSFVGAEAFIHYQKGWVPQTFVGLEDLRLCFAHIDLDLYQGILDCLEFVYPRLSAGGVIIFDDYGFASCPGARRAVEEFFADKPEKPLALMTGQALVHKL